MVKRFRQFSMLGELLYASKGTIKEYYLLKKEFQNLRSQSQARIFTGSLEVTTTWTYWTIQRPNGTSNSEGQGVIMTKDRSEVATATGQGEGKMVESGKMRYVGALFYETHSKDKLAFRPLHDIYVFQVFRHCLKQTYNVESQQKIMTFNKILVPYDSSKASDNAFSNALKIAKMSNESERIHKQGDVITRIILLHVLQEIPVPPNFGGTALRRLSEKTGETITFREYLKEVYQEMKASAIKMLDQRTREHTINITNVKIKPKVTIGLPADKILETAIEENVDLIIMGTTGLTGVSKIKALGSVARNVSERAKCPVMLVR